MEETGDRNSKEDEVAVADVYSPLLCSFVRDSAQDWHQQKAQASALSAADRHSQQRLRHWSKSAFHFDHLSSETTPCPHWSTASSRQAEGRFQLLQVASLGHDLHDLDEGASALIKDSGYVA